MSHFKSLSNYKRFNTIEVKVGPIAIGGKNPIHIQSMTTANTMNTSATVDESIRMIDAGCKLVRITAPSKKDAENLANIKNELRLRGYKTPLVADIHYTPNAAETAAKIVEKVRINPGNYADKKKFEEIDYTDESYNNELLRIEEKFTPLVQICKQNNTSMRIGTNHGSLSDRILSRYGDTPKGMVESALEFIRICRKHDYHNIVISMKASNTRVMVYAYRLLVNEMIKEGMKYPLHLGVTEAGEGEDGRIKSAVGIGTLLSEGIGDTIRVSLTEAPEYEMPVAQKILDHFKDIHNHKKIAETKQHQIDYFQYEKRKTFQIENIGNKNVPIVISDLSNRTKITQASFFSLGYRYSVPLDKWHISEMASDFIYIGENEINFEIPGTLRIISNYSSWIEHKKGFPIFNLKEYGKIKDFNENLNFLKIYDHEMTPSLIDILKNNKSVVIFLVSENINCIGAMRKFFFELMEKKIENPVIISRKYEFNDDEQLQISASIDIGSLLIDGFGDGICISSNNCSNKMLNSISFGILQASRTRISKTEYISCPSCGRTLFDLQETTAKIRKVTDHLKGVKIGIMGCIVNGPGEMADADYGYVGTGPGKITLYKEKTVVKKNVPENEAVDALIDLIKENGDWVDKSN
ncbi:MAG: 4-hydroxy-3-methylbut-2-en-1-yl diphosphate synthase [Flavobacteriales bacterium TMED84]|nr:MAG: 4-hydroxy-3-methylbut-2-en-1-yl diphosphate synthase [Flavobacteriales bacterium TMED84]